MHVKEECDMTAEHSEDTNINEENIKLVIEQTHSSLLENLTLPLEQIETSGHNEYPDTAKFVISEIANSDDYIKMEPIELYEIEAKKKAGLQDPEMQHDKNEDNESDSDDENDDSKTDSHDTPATSNLINCFVCQKSVSKKCHRRHLLQIHNMPFTCKCKVCNTPFASKKELRTHVSDVHQGKGYPCEICSKTFRDKYSGNRHMESSHLKIDKVTCNICKKEIQKEYLHKHLQIHTTRDKFKCTHCDKDFHSESGLKSHILVVHEGSKTHACETCGKCFANSGNLKVHRNLHSDVRPFICSYCGHGFNQESNLKEHINIHTGEKPYACKVCSKTFTQSRQLSAHMRIHTRHKPYKCKIGDCERAYINAIDMKRHRFSVHGVYTKKHICHICSKVYPERKLLTKHLVTH